MIVLSAFVLTKLVLKFSHFTNYREYFLFDWTKASDKSPDI